MHEARARLLAVRGAALLVVLIAACSRTTPPPAPTPEPVAEAPPPTPRPTARPAPPSRSLITIIDTVFLLTNRERARASLTPLRRNPELARAAQLHAEQMAAAGKLAHDLPNARYPTLASRLRLVGYTYRAVGENVAEGYTSGAALMAGWMTSTAHRSNILSARYTETGVGMARSKSGRTYHAQVFARPRAPATTGR
ncbi:MAG TPA: CAP domain-containing protein [Gemmatimonadaceae bacterium]|nr:CAP domain-containing protein [Gemmatimonadaceae bacterium]